MCWMDDYAPDFQMVVDREHTACDDDAQTIGSDSRDNPRLVAAA